MSPTAAFKKKRHFDLAPRVVISGYYGFDNLGDELILRVLVDELKTQGVAMTVLSNEPEKTAREYGVDAVHRMNLIDIIDALTQANLFISGGGGLFQDVTGPMSTLYYGGLIHLARFFEVPVCFWAQGVGPLQQGLSRSITASALRKCEKITVRDEKSAALVESLIGDEPEITADPVWLLSTAVLKNQKEGDTAKKPVRKGKKSDRPWRVGISLRTWPALTPERMRRLADCLKTLAQEKAQANQPEGKRRPVEFVLLPFQKNEDLELLNAFGKMLDGVSDAQCVMIEPERVITEIGQCDALFGMRFHSLILGLLHKIPVYGLMYDPKVANLIEMFELQGCPVDNLEAIDPAVILAYFENYPSVDLKPHKRESRRNVAVLKRLLKIPDAELLL